MTRPDAIAPTVAPEDLRRWHGRLVACVAAVAVLSIALLVGAVVAPNVPTTAWNRVGTVTALSAFYCFLAYRVRSGSARALRRLHISVVIGIVGVAVVVVLPGAYPWWMRVEQAVQLVLLLAIGHIITRPQLRAGCPGWDDTALFRRIRRR